MYTLRSGREGGPEEQREEICARKAELKDKHRDSAPLISLAEQKVQSSCVGPTVAICQQSGGRTGKMGAELAEEEEHRGSLSRPSGRCRPGLASLAR